MSTGQDPPFLGISTLHHIHLKIKAFWIIFGILLHFSYPFPPFGYLYSFLASEVACNGGTLPLRGGSLTVLSSVYAYGLPIAKYRDRQAPPNASYIPTSLWKIQKIDIIKCVLKRLNPHNYIIRQSARRRMWLAHAVNHGSRFLTSAESKTKAEFRTVRAPVLARACPQCKLRPSDKKRRLMWHIGFDY